MPKKHPPEPVTPTRPLGPSIIPTGRQVAIRSGRSLRISDMDGIVQAGALQRQLDDHDRQNAETSAAVAKLQGASFRLSIGPSADIRLSGGNVHDMKLPDADVIRITPAAVGNLTGIDGGQPGMTRVLIIREQLWTLMHENTGSRPENRFSLGQAADMAFGGITGEGAGAATIYYDDGISRWVVLGGNL